MVKDRAICNDLDLSMMKLWSCTSKKWKRETIFHRLSHNYNNKTKVSIKSWLLYSIPYIFYHRDSITYILYHVLLISRVIVLFIHIHIVYFTVNINGSVSCVFYKVLLISSVFAPFCFRYIVYLTVNIKGSSFIVSHTFSIIHC